MEIGQCMQPRAYQVVIVGPPSISRDQALARSGLAGLLGAISRCQHEQAAGAFQDMPGMLIGVGPTGNVFHLPGETVGEPLVQCFNPRRSDGRGGSSQIKTESL